MKRVATIRQARALLLVTARAATGGSKRCGFGSDATRAYLRCTCGIHSSRRLFGGTANALTTERCRGRRTPPGGGWSTVHQSSRLVGGDPSTGARAAAPSGRQVSPWLAGGPGRDGHGWSWRSLGTYSRAQLRVNAEKVFEVPGAERCGRFGFDGRHSCGSHLLAGDRHSPEFALWYP